jgi:hypothetical protein
VFCAFAIPLIGIFVASAEIGGKIGIIQTVAGSFPDHTQALKADIAGPTSAAADAAGNIYVATFFGGTVFKITPSGQAIPFAGNGTFGFSGDNGRG